jgi:lipid A ethanolaminephosphotransferase
MKKITISPEILILIVSAYIASISNMTFWHGIFTRLNLSSIQSLGYIFTSFFIIVFLLTIIFFVFGQKALLKPVLVFVLIFSATISYFNQELGVVFDKEMIRNIVDTINERNIYEAIDLLSFPLFLYVFAMGVVPSIFVSLINTHQHFFLRTFISRSLFASGILLVIASTFILNYKFYTYFYRQNEDLLVYVTPIYPLVAVKKYIKQQRKKKSVFHEIGNDAHQVKTSKKKVVGIMVVGETSRADHFSLNGYSRQTNPLLSRYDNLIYYKNIHACGTSTAYSVPCMFSFFNRKDYSPEKARQYSNVLDVLKKSNVSVVWEENNSSCKGVCLRTEEINIIGHTDKTSEYYYKGRYYDEILIDYFDSVIDNLDTDVLLVLHTMGSHGPQYNNRYPDSFATFKPDCKKASPQECNREQIINAYDNTILYTDYFLSQVIDYLIQHENNYDSFMMYASDHGESLGENGVYLHGLPYFMAPEAQTHVPFLMWFSDAFVEDENIKLKKLNNLTNVAYTHDNLSHTLLGLFEVETKLYDRNLDILYKTTTE